MKKLLLSFALVATSSLLSAQSNWSVDAAHSNVRFTVSHLVISEVEGTFKTFDGKITSKGNDFTDASVEFNVDVNSINTDNTERDDHLKSDDFFNAAKFPFMIFKSTSFRKVDEKTYKLVGNLTIRDVTKSVTFDVVHKGVTKDPWGNIKAGFKATSSINRKDFNLMWSVITESGGLVVGDDVAITINLELSQNK